MMLVEEMAEGIGRAHGAALDAVTRALWASVATGQIGDDDAARLSAAIEARRLVRKAIGSPKRFGGITLRPRPCPDRAAALERSRRWAASGRMPPAIACRFTPKEQAALAVIAFEVTKSKVCDQAIGAIAALAGVSESTVKRALRLARRLGLLTVQERRVSRYRNDTNLIRIICKAWLSWIDLGGVRTGVQPRPGTNTGRSKKGNGRAAEAAKGLPRRRDRTGGDAPPTPSRIAGSGSGSCPVR